MGFVLNILYIITQIENVVASFVVNVSCKSVCVAKTFPAFLMMCKLACDYYPNFKQQTCQNFFRIAYSLLIEANRKFVQC